MALLERTGDDRISIQTRLNSTHRGHRDVVRSAFYNPTVRPYPLSLFRNCTSSLLLY
jgi:hypothetical protein